jgi:choline kinase
MKAIILAAGKGTRLQELTRGKPKSLLKIRNTTLLNELVDQLQNSHIDEIIVVVGYKADQIKKAVPKAKFIFNKDFDKGNNILSVWAAREEILGHDCLILYADLILDQTILEDCVKINTSCLAVSQQPVLEHTERVITDGNHLIKDIGPHLTIESANGNFIGVAKLVAEDTHDFISSIKSLLHEKNAYFTRAIKKMIETGHKIHIVNVNKRFWAEIDLPEDYEKVVSNEYLGL